MNHSYRLVWSDATQRYVPAPETARGRGKSRGAKALLLGVLLAAHAGAQALPSHALPTGGQVVDGKATIGQAGSQMTIDQASSRAIVHWQGFDIGSGSKVQFRQPDANAIALNRVVGSTGSQIHGQLSANGQVWLVNPNGVVFGNGSQVNVGGLVASTMDITNADFNADRQVFRRGAAQGGITHQGNITVADGGTLALLAPTVKNEGTLSARLGNVVLAGGDKVTLQAGADGRLQVAVDPATVRTLIDNKHLITADGGQVVMTSGAADALSASVVSNSGTVQARTLDNKEGRILLLADMRHGEVVHSGLLDASAPAGGDGGVVDTSAAMVRIEASARVTTAAPQGKTGNWLIDPTDLAISAGGGSRTSSGIGADTLMNSLRNTSVTLQTVAEGAEKGDIHVNAPVTWSRNTLTLNAHGSINVNAVMTASGTAGLEMNYGGYAANGTAAEGSGVNMKLTDQDFLGRVDFTGRNDSGATTNRLKINGESYTILTQLGSMGSTTARDLQGIKGSLSGKYALGGNIDASATQGWSEGAGFAPIGDAEAAFTGVFEGLGHHITGLNVNRPEQSFAGLFGDALNATLRNVGLVDASVKGSEFAGALVGRQQASNGARAYIGNAYATGAIAGESRVGGLVGQNRSDNGATAHIEYAHSAAAVEGGYQVGGLIGYNEADNGGTRIAHVHSTAQVTDHSEFGQFTGGLIGGNASVNGGIAFVSNAYATGHVTGNYFTGGLLGGHQSFTDSALYFENAYATGNVKGSTFGGGLVGYMVIAAGSTSKMANVHATGSVEGNAIFGGLVGFVGTSHSTSTISHAYATGRVDGNAQLGGLIGSSSAGSGGATYIEDAFATGAVYGTNNFLGGLVGHHTAEPDGTASIANAYASGQVTQVGTRGDHDGDQSGNAETVATGDGAIGGLVGRNGIVDGGTASIRNSYSTGRVSGRSTAGGLVGENYGSLDASFYATTDVAGAAINTGSTFNTLGHGRSWKELTQLSTFAGWDIDDQGGTGRAWRVYYGLATPLLRSFLRPVSVAVDGSGVYDKVYDGGTASGPLQYTMGEPGVALLGRLGYASTGSDVGRYATSRATLKIGGLYSDQLGYDIRYENTGNLSLVITPPVQADELARRACRAGDLYQRELFPDALRRDGSTDRHAAPRIHDIRCVQRRWTVAGEQPQATIANPGLLTRTADFIRLP